MRMTPRAFGASRAFQDCVRLRYRDHRPQTDRDDPLQPPGELQRMARVLVEVVAGIDDEPFERNNGGVEDDLATRA